MREITNKSYTTPADVASCQGDRTRTGGIGVETVAHRPRLGSRFSVQIATQVSARLDSSLDLCLLLRARRAQNGGSGAGMERAIPEGIVTLTWRPFPTFDYRRVALWLLVLLVPGGILLVPLLIADIRRRRASQPRAGNQGAAPLPRLAA